MTNTDKDGTQVWRYEVRGSSLYDKHEQRTVSIFEAGEILNAHEALLLKEGLWAAKAGRMAWKADGFKAQRDALVDTQNAIQAQSDALAAALKEARQVLDAADGTSTLLRVGRHPIPDACAVSAIATIDAALAIYASNPASESVT